MSQHTKGPWHIVEDRTHGSLEVFSEDTAIAEMWRRGNKTLEMANAQLIAAAPELLAALEALLDYENGIQKAIAEQMARAAIAKAGGE